MELSDRVAIVTGASSGIGRAIATELGRAGASVVVVDLLGATEAAAEIGAVTGARAIGLTADVSSKAETSSMAEEVEERLGAIDILVNNAALFAELTGGPFEEVALEEWRRVLEVNVIGPYLCARAVLAAMRRAKGGAIVNLASGTVFKGVPNRLHYVTSKGAVIAFTRALASELGRDNIRVNAIAPGFTLSEGVLRHEEAFEASRAAAPGSRALKREQLPTDVAGAARFLCGPASSFITGQT
ncbi:MAG: SDR family NAD(P)-dependent oxidoreductase, partial [Acidimicrobiales bacterium]